MSLRSRITICVTNIQLEGIHVRKLPKAICKARLFEERFFPSKVIERNKVDGSIKSSESTISRKTLNFKRPYTHTSFTKCDLTGLKHFR